MLVNTYSLHVCTVLLDRMPIHISISVMINTPPLAFTFREVVYWDSEAPGYDGKRLRSDTIGINNSLKGPPAAWRSDRWVPT